MDVSLAFANFSSFDSLNSDAEIDRESARKIARNAFRQPLRRVLHGDFVTQRFTRSPLSSRANVHHVARLTVAQGIEVVGPGLHHLPSLRKSLSAIVGGPNLVALSVSELQFDQIRMPALLVQKRRRECPETVTGHLVLGVSEPAQRRVDRVLAHRPAAAALARKSVAPAASQRLNLAHDGDGFYVTAVYFGTSNGRYSDAYGRGGGDWGFTYRVPDGYEIAGFWGRSGIWVDALGVMVRSRF